MNAEFLIDVQEWLGDAEDPDIEEATFADLKMSAHDDRYLVTRVRHEEEDHPRDSIRMPTYPLACWFATNWWRLRWEPEKSGVEWRLAHKMSGTGGGYQWPDVSFSSDGDFIRVQSLQTPATGRYSDASLRYLNTFDVHVSSTAFEKAIDDFLDAVIKQSKAALQRKGTEAFDDAADLKGLWKEVREERADPKMGLWRKMEAILGFDPDDAPEAQMQLFLKMMETYGRAAVEEMMAVPAGRDPQKLKQFWKESRSRAFNMKVPEADRIRQRMEDRAGENRAEYGAVNSLVPWQRGYGMAAIVRDAWGLQSGPLRSEVLLDRMGVSSKSRKALHQTRKNAVSTGFRSGSDSGKLSASIYRSNKTGQRFTLARLVGDHLDRLDQEEKLLPVTGARTSRQKFQRAFAQELLCPYESLREHIDNEQDINGDNVKKIALHYDVAPEMILRTLENHSDTSPSILKKARLQLAA